MNDLIGFLLLDVLVGLAIFTAWRIHKHIRGERLHRTKDIKHFIEQYRAEHSQSAGPPRRLPRPHRLRFGVGRQTRVRQGGPDRPRLPAPSGVSHDREEIPLDASTPAPELACVPPVRTGGGPPHQFRDDLAAAVTVRLVHGLGPGGRHVAGQPVPLVQASRALVLAERSGLGDRALCALVDMVEVEPAVTIQWLRRGAQRTTYAFRDLEITRFPTAMPLGPCGEFKVADLVDDPNAAKCVKCETPSASSNESRNRWPTRHGPVARAG